MALSNPLNVVGQINTFGEFGPKYQVGQPLRQLENGDWMIQIILIESGEETEYLLSHINDDPEAV